MKLHHTFCIFSNLQLLIAIKSSLPLKYKTLKRSLLSIVILSCTVLITACMSNNDTDSSGQDQEEQHEDTVSTGAIPGGHNIPSVDKPSGKVQLSQTIAKLSTPTSPAFSLDMTYRSNTYLDTLSSTKSIPNSDVGMGWTFYANRFSVSRVNMGTGSFEDDAFKMQMGTDSYSLQYQCDYPCSYHPNDKESTSIDDNTYKIKYYVTNDTDFSVIKHIINTNDTSQTYSTWKVTTKDGKTYLFGGNSFTNTASLRTEEKDISDRTICKWLTNTAQFTTGSVTVPGKLATGCQPGSVNVGVRWGNWIGANDYSSHKGETETTNQEQFGAAWKLTAIEDIRGQKTNLFWAQNTQNVGLNGATDQSTITSGIKSFSRDSYLYKIEAANGDRLVLNYCPRGNDSSTVVGNYSISSLKSDRPKSYYECEVATNLPKEAYDTNTVNIEPDGFQEPVRTMYLVAVDTVLNQPANQENSTGYDYNPDTRALLDYDAVTMENNFSRRILVGIETITKNQKITTVNQLTQFSPKTIFCYYGYISSANNCDDQATIAGSEGLLSKVLDTLGNETHYSYKQQQLTNDNLSTTIAGELGLTSKTIVYGNGYAIVQGIRERSSGKFFDLDIYDMTPTGWKLHNSLMNNVNLGPFSDSYFFDQNIAFVPNGFIFRASDKTLWFIKRTLGTTSSWEQPQILAHNYFGYENIGKFAVGTNFVGVMSNTGAEYAVLSTFDNWETLEPVAIGSGTTGTLPSSSAPNTLQHITAGPNYLAFWRAGTSSLNHIVTTDIIYQKENQNWPIIAAPIHKQLTNPAFCTDYMNEKNCEAISVTTSDDIPQAPSISDSQNGAVLAVDIPIEITVVNFADQDIVKNNVAQYTNYQKGTLSYTYAYWLDIPLDWDESSMALNRVKPLLPTDEQISLSPFWWGYVDPLTGDCDPNVDKSPGYINSYLNGYQASALKTKYGAYRGGFRQQYIPVTKYTEKPCASSSSYTNIYTTDKNDQTESYSQCKFVTGSNVVIYDTYLTCQGNISQVGDTMLSLGANGLYQFYNYSPRSYSFDKVAGPNPSTSSLGTYTLVTPSSIANDIAVSINIAFELTVSMAAMSDPVGLVMMVAGEGLSVMARATQPNSHYDVHWSSSNVSSIAAGGRWIYQGDVLYYQETNGALSEVYGLADADNLKSKYFGALYNYIPFVVDDGTNHTIKIQNLANLDSSVTEQLWKDNTVTVSSVSSSNSQLYTVGQYNPVVKQGSNPLKEESGRGAWDRYTNLAGPGAFLTYEHKQSSATSFYSSGNNTPFELHAVWSEYNASGFIDYVVDVVTTKDGISSDENAVSYDYDLLQSSYSVAMQSGLYGRVTAYPGSENSIENFGKVVYKSHYGEYSSDQTLLYGMPISTSVYKQGQLSPIHQSFHRYQIDEYDLSVGSEQSNPKSVSVRTANLASVISIDDQVINANIYDYTDYNLLKSITSADTLNFKPANTNQPRSNSKQTTYTYAWEDTALSEWTKATNRLSVVENTSTTKTVGDLTEPKTINNVEDKQDISEILDSLGPVQLGFLSFDRLEPAVPLTMGCFQSATQAQVRNNNLDLCNYHENRVMSLVKVGDGDGFTVSNTQAILKDGRVFDYELLSKSAVYQIRVSSQNECLTAVPKGDPQEPDLMTISDCDQTSNLQLFQFLSGKVTATEDGKIPETSFHTSLALANLNLCFNSFTYGWQVWSPCGMFIDSDKDPATLTTPADVVIYKANTQSKVQTADTTNVFEWCKVPSENGGINSCTTTQPTPNVTNLGSYAMMSKQQNTLRNTEWNNGDTASLTPTTVVSRDPGSLLSTEVMDPFGTTQSVTVSNDGHFNPIAQFKNASASKMEATYQGFESYEEDITASNNWTTRGGSLTELQQHSGSSSYGNESSEIWMQTASNINVSTGANYYVASAWVRTSYAPCTLSIGGSSISSTINGAWQYLEKTVTASSASNNPVSVKCTVGGFVDDLRYSPVDSDFKANVYSAINNSYNPFWQIQASLDDNGSVTLHIYDQWHKPYGEIFIPITGTQRTHIPPVPGLSRLGGAGVYSYATYEQNSFSASTPNSIFKLSFSDADYDATFNSMDQVNKNTPNNNSNAQGSTSTVDASFTKVILKKPNFAARAMLVNPSISEKTTLFTWNNLSLNFAPSSSNLGKFVIDNTSTSEQFCSTDTDIYIPHDWIITAYDGLIVILGDGKLLMYCDNYGDNSITTPSFELVGDLWQNLILAYDPTITMSYADATGRPVQYHTLGMGVDIGMDNTSAVSSDTYTTVVRGVVYDHWGHSAIKGMPIVANYGFDYGPALMSFDWANNELQTDSDLYGFYSSSNSSDAKYAFLQTAYEQSPLGRPVNRVSTTGQLFSLNASDNYSNFQDYQKPDEQSFATDQGITSYEPFLTVNTMSQAFGTATKYNQSAVDQSGNKVYSLTTSGSSTTNSLLSANIKFGGQYDMQIPGSPWVSQSSLLLPNYFDTSISGSSNFVNQTQQKDNLGLWTTAVKPDVSGMRHVIKDNKGRVRFAGSIPSIEDTEVLSVMAENFSYWKYDLHDRVVEMGTLSDYSGSANYSKSAYDLANNTSFPASNESCRKSAFLYDAPENLTISGVSAEEQQSIIRNWRGRLVNSLTMMSLIPESPQGAITKTSQCVEGESKNTSFTSHYYNDFGSNIGISETVFNETATTLSSRNTGYDFDNQGAVNSITYPTVDRSSEISTSTPYNFNLSGQVTLYNLKDSMQRLNAVCDKKTTDSVGNTTCAGNQYVKATAYTFDKLFSHQALGNSIVEKSEYNFQRKLALMKTQNASGDSLFSEKLYYGISSNGSSPSVCGTQYYNSGYIVAKEISSSAESALDKTECYTYDVAGRLTQMLRSIDSESTKTTYTYDPNGNMLSETHSDPSDDMNYTYKSGSNQLSKLSNSSVAPSYSDEGGVMILPVKPDGKSTVVTNTFTRDYQNQVPMQITNENCTVNYSYDTYGRRVKKESVDVASNSCSSN